MPTTVVFALFSAIFFLSISGQFWQSYQYYGTPVAEDAVGSVVFDPAIGTSDAQCLSLNSTSSVTLTLDICSVVDALDYFNVSNNRVVMAKAYYLSERNHPSTIGVCQLSCGNAYGISSQAYLTIYIVTGNRFAPVFNTTFPRVFTVYQTAPTMLMQTDAYDLDLDSATAGRVTYSVASVDGRMITAGVNDFVSYTNNGSNSKLLLTRDPGWLLTSTHTIVITARDNAIDVNTRKTTTTTLTINYAIPVTPGPSNAPPLSSLGPIIWSSAGPSGMPDASTASGPTIAATTASAMLTATANTQSASSSTVAGAKSDDCEGAKLLVCGKNWIYLTSAICGFVALAVVITIICCMQKKKQEQLDAAKMKARRKQTAERNHRHRVVPPPPPPQQRIHPYGPMWPQMYYPNRPMLPGQTMMNYY